VTCPTTRMCPFELSSGDIIIVLVLFTNYLLEQT
jgi:hypothetical protein